MTTPPDSSSLRTSSLRTSSLRTSSPRTGPSESASGSEASAGPVLEGPWMAAAQLLRPQGRRGELLAEPLVEFPVFSKGRRFWLAPTPEAVPPPTAGRAGRWLEDAWEPTGKNAGRAVLKLTGVDSISDAEALAGQFLVMPVAEMPALDPGTFRVRDLVGCALFDGEQLAGTVVDVQFPVAANGRTRLEDAPDLLAVLPVRTPEVPEFPKSEPGSEPIQEPILVPFVRAWLVTVDIASKRIVMHLPPGLLDDADPVL